MTACCIPPLPGFEYQLGHVKVVRDIGLSGGFPQLLQFALDTT